MNLDFENKMSPFKTPNLLISFLSKSMKISEVAFLNKKCALEIYDRPPQTMHWTSYEPLPPLENVDTKGEIFWENTMDITDTVL